MNIWEKCLPKKKKCTFQAYSNGKFSLKKAFFEWIFFICRDMTNVCFMKCLRILSKIVMKIKLKMSWTCFEWDW